MSEFLESDFPCLNNTKRINSTKSRALIPSGNATDTFHLAETYRRFRIKSRKTVDLVKRETARY